MFGFKKNVPLDPLNAVLLRWTRSDPFTLGHLLHGGLITFGGTGSGKTTTSGNAIGDAVIATSHSGGLILAAKPEDVGMWRKLFRRHRREDDLIVFGSLTDRWRFNLLQYIGRSAASARDISSAIRTIGQSLQSSGDKGRGENGDFFESQENRLLECAVEVVKQATGEVTAPDLHRFITTSATTLAELGSPDWQARFHNQCIRSAYKRKKTSIESHDFELASNLFLGELPTMADKTRSSIFAGVLGILHVFNSGIVRELLSTTTNVTPDDLFKRKWVLVNLPPAKWGDTGAFVCAAWKYQAQQANLRRHARPNDPIHVIWFDEAQQFFNDFDVHYLAQCRSHRGCMVCLTQSVHSCYSRFKGEAGRSQADALLANFRHKLFHAVGDPQTAEWASSLIGKSLQTFVGGSSQNGGDAFDAMLGRSQYTGSFSEHYEQIVQPNVFLSGLRTGGPSNNFIADAIVIRSGEPFSNGQSYLRCSFNQRG